MTTPSKARPRLAAARPAHDEESAGYMPRLPWRWILLGTLSVSTLMAGYWLSQRNKAEALRAQIVNVHQEQLAEPARRYLALRTKLEDLVLDAASKPPERFADKRLRLSGLRGGKGLYLRLPAKQAHARRAIEQSATEMEADAIPACLGLAPASARGLFEKGAFLTPEWLSNARKNESVMSLRVTDTMLAHHIRADLPAVLNMLRSDWFLLVLQQGENRRDQPVDALLWDLRSGQRLLSGRVQAIGVLLSARIQSKDAPGGPHMTADQVEVGAANDCSIAAQIKQLAGSELASVEHEPPPPGAGATPAAQPPAAVQPVVPTKTVAPKDTAPAP